MQQLVTPSAIPSPKFDVESRALDDELFLINPDDATTAVHCLNGGAALIWLLCDGTRDVETIVDEISSAFDLPADEVLDDVRKTVAHLESLRLLET